MCVWCLCVSVRGKSEREEGWEVEDCGAPSVCKQGLSDGTSSVDSAETGLIVLALPFRTLTYKNISQADNS